MRVKMVVAYDGTNYSGWQLQKNAVTIEQKLNEALYDLLGEEIQVTGASRTDAGVHALNYVGNAFFDTDYESERVLSGVNAVLPEDIRVFHMGTSVKDGKYYTSGGRVLMVVGFGADLQDAHDKALAAVESIECDNLFYRRDIGWRVL